MARRRHRGSGFDTNICTSKAAREAARKQHQWETTFSLFSPSLRHTPAPIRGIRRKRKVLQLLYFQQGCTVQSHSHFQSPGLNPLAGEGVCLRIALTAGAWLPVLGLPSKRSIGRSSLRTPLLKAFSLSKTQKKKRRETAVPLIPFSRTLRRFCSVPGRKVNSEL